jgi:signal transduction histidine kinase
MRRELEGRPFVETFAADLSHELKNPVAAIKASAEVLSDGALDEPALARGFVDRISEATSRIEVLLGELLSLARIEARGVSAAEPVDLRQVIDGEVPPEGRELVVDGPAEPALVRGDALWLSRLVHNLIDNAVKHSAAGTIRVSLASSGTTLSLSVENDGAVAEHVRAKLFRRFVTTRAGWGWRSRAPWPKRTGLPSDARAPDRRSCASRCFFPPSRVGRSASSCPSERVRSHLLKSKQTVLHESSTLGPSNLRRRETMVPGS